MDDLAGIRNILEAALLVAGEPLGDGEDPVAGEELSEDPLHY